MKDRANVAMNRSVGFVTKMRLSPRDVMSCIDAVHAVKAEMQGMSLSAVCKRGIAIALHTLRSGGVLPERDGFEYLDMIAPYNNITRVEKIAAGHKMVMQEQRDEVADVQPPILPKAQKPRFSEDDIAYGLRRARLVRQIQELEFKEDADKLNFTKEDQKRLRLLRAELNN